MEELSKTEIGRARLGFATERMDRSLAEHVEYHDDRKARVQGEKVDDVPSVPLHDPFQIFEPLQARDVGTAEALPSSSHEPMVMPEESVCDTPVVPP